MDTSYTSRTYFYRLALPGGGTTVLEAPYTNIEDPAIFGNTLQRPFDVTVDEVNASVSSLVVDAWLGVRANLWRTLDFFLGYRITNYGDVALDLRPDGAETVGGTNVNTFTEVSRSVTYEGLYTGLGYRF